MARKVDSILKQAMGLSQADRAFLAERLISSLDGPADPDAEAAWEIEIGRRIKEVESGKVKLVPWEKVRKDIKKSLRSHR